ncbi:MAG: tetratricopeptide repeat protein [Emticicia sp.]|uniref:tetratricopeptide repeat protein n=1 Tax=Emticicia sp. TaxID=1930953 RepID=UPI003BA6D2F0
MKLFFGILFFLTFSVKSFAQLLNDPESKQLIIKGLDKLYNYELKEADSYFHAVKAKYPKHPVTPLLGALQVQWQHLPIEQNPKALAQYLALLEKCQLSAESLLQDPTKKAEAIFFLVASHGYIALVLNYKKEQVKAANESRKAYGYLKDGRQYIEKNPEFLFTSGLYNFYRIQYPETHPIAKPAMIFFENGNKKLGLQQLEQAVQKSVFSRIEASFYLMNIFLKYESNYSKALIYSNWLHERYPNNLVYTMRHTESLIMNGKIDEALPLIQQLKRTNDKVYLLAGNLFEGLVNEKFRKNDKAAADLYVNVLKMQPNERYTNDYFAMAYAGLARISIRSGNTKRAEELYRRCLEYAEYNSTKNEANNFLK